MLTRRGASLQRQLRSLGDVGLQALGALAPDACVIPACVALVTVLVLALIDSDLEPENGVAVVCAAEFGVLADCPRDDEHFH